MADVLFVFVIVAFFGVAVLLVRACDRIIGPDPVLAAVDDVSPGEDAEAIEMVRMTADNIVGARHRRADRRLPRVRPRLPGEVLMSTAVDHPARGADRALGDLDAAARRYMAKVYGDGGPPPATGSSARSSGSSTGCCRVDPERRAALEHLRLLAARVPPGVGPRPLRPAAAPGRPAAQPRRPGGRAADAVVQHRGQLPDQHQLAELLGRVDDVATSPRWPASRSRTSCPPPSGMAVAVAFIRGLVRRRSDHLGNFWVDLIRTIVRILLPLVVRPRASCSPEPGRHRQNFNAAPAGHHRRRSDPDDPRRPGRQPGGDQGARHQRRRLLQRQLDPPVREPQRVHQPARRSGCCSPSRSPCRSPSARWPRTRSRAGWCSPPCSSSGSVCR